MTLSLGTGTGCTRRRMERDKAIWSKRGLNWHHLSSKERTSHSSRRRRRMALKLGLGLMGLGLGPRAAAESLGERGQVLIGDGHLKDQTTIHGGKQF